MSKRISRRQFLVLSGGAVATLLLEACRRGTPAPTPTPTRTPSPTNTPSPTTAPSPRPTLTPTLAQAPTATPEPQPATETPKPTATPTPPPTPFPPGPPSKLGLFVSRNEPVLFDLLRTGGVAVVKTLEYDSNYVADIKRASPHTLVVARYAALETPDLGNWNPIEAAHRFVDELLPIATSPTRLANIDAWEAHI